MLEGLLVGLYVYILATLLGSELINNVPQMLHTPLKCRVECGERSPAADDPQ